MPAESSIVSILLSGTAGALIATTFGAVVDLWRDQIRLRASVMLTVVGWADDTNIRVMDLHVAKHAEYGGAKPYLSQQEYDVNSRELRSLLLRSSARAQLAIVYGEGEELKLMDALHGKLLEAARKLWRAKKADWGLIGPEVERQFSEEIDPLRAKLERRLLQRANLSLLFSRLKERLVEGPGWQGPSVDER